MGRAGGVWRTLTCKDAKTAHAKIAAVFNTVCTNLMRRAHGSWVLLIAVALLSVSLAGCGPATVSDGTPEASAVTATPVTGHAAATRIATATLPTTIDGFKVVLISSLPKEARNTLTLIARGGPFPYRQDGVVFQNREGYLPHQRSGYYHEYTVITPGSSDRGARRIITGSGGEIYYTSDHYNTFVRVLQQ